MIMISWTRVFKIRRTSDGFFKRSTFNNVFDAVGDTWSSIGEVLFYIHKNRKYLSECKLVEYQLEEVGSDSIANE